MASQRSELRASDSTAASVRELSRFVSELQGKVTSLERERDMLLASREALRAHLVENDSDDEGDVTLNDDSEVNTFRLCMRI